MDVRPTRQLFRRQDGDGDVVLGNSAIHQVHTYQPRCRLLYAFLT